MPASHAGVMSLRKRRNAIIASATNQMPLWKWNKAGSFGQSEKSIRYVKLEIGRRNATNVSSLAHYGRRPLSLGNSVRSGSLSMNT
jgi:hypothetical protein